VKAEPHWNRRPSEAEPAWERPYVDADILCEGQNRSRRRINGTTIFCAITLILWALAIIF
jgi:hypothetical protein